MSPIVSPAGGRGKSTASVSPFTASDSGDAGWPPLPRAHPLHLIHVGPGADPIPGANRLSAEPMRCVDDHISQANDRRGGRPTVAPANGRGAEPGLAIAPTDFAAGHDGPNGPRAARARPDGPRTAGPGSGGAGPARDDPAGRQPAESVTLSGPARPVTA